MDLIKNRIIKKYNLLDNQLDMKTLDINRNNLMFDKKVNCHYLNRNDNIFSCLSCGIYWFGKSDNTPVYEHSLNKNHDCFLDLFNKKIYLISENKEIKEQYLYDILFNLEPFYVKEDLNFLKKEISIRNNLERNEYYLGYIQIKNCYYLNIFVQIILKCSIVKNSLLINNFNKNTFIYLFSNIIKKLFNPFAFRNYIIPIEFIESFDFLNNDKNILNKDFSKFLTYFMKILPEEFSSFFKIQIFKKIIDKKNKDEITLTNTYILKIKIPDTPVFIHTSKKIIPEYSIEDLINLDNFYEPSDLLNKKYIQYITNFPDILIIKLIRKDYDKKINNSIINYKNKIEIKNFETNTSMKYILLANLDPNIFSIYDNYHKSYFLISKNSIKKSKKINYSTTQVTYLIYKLIKI